MSDKKVLPLAIRWNQATLDAIKYTATSPPLAARALAMVHTAMYNSWSVYDEKAISTHTALYIKKLEEKVCIREAINASVSYAAFRVLTDLFWLQLKPRYKNIFLDLFTELGHDADYTDTDISSASGIGNLAARMVLEDRAGDGSNPHATLHFPAWSDYTGYQPINTWDNLKEPDRWQPLRNEVAPGIFKVQHFLVPHWGLVKPCVLEYNWQFRPTPPYLKHQSQFKEQAAEILKLSAELTDRQKAIADYWADGHGSYTPPGHWCEIGQFVASSCKYDDEDCIKLFFALTIALLDAAIASWECKRRYDSARPVSVIRFLYHGKDIQAWGGPGKGTQTIRGEAWNSYLATPPIAEHVSVHSSFSRAAAIIFASYTGSDEFGGCTVIDKHCSVTEKGHAPKQEVIVEWKTFTEAAEQAGTSMLWGGIHFSKGNREGQVLGRDIGQLAWKKSVFYFNS